MYLFVLFIYCQVHHQHCFHYHIYESYNTYSCFNILNKYASPAISLYIFYLHHHFLYQNCFQIHSLIYLIRFKQIIMLLFISLIPFTESFNLVTTIIIDNHSFIVLPTPSFYSLI